MSFYIVCVVQTVCVRVLEIHTVIFVDFEKLMKIICLIKQQNDTVTCWKKEKKLTELYISRNIGIYHPK
jgi:hypothetical protein